MAIILVGSYAKGCPRKYSDIDIIIFPKAQYNLVERQEIRFKGHDLDIRSYSKDYFLEVFQKKAVTPNQLGEISLFLAFLREAVIWYQEGSFLDKYIVSAKTWEWSPDDEMLLEFPFTIPKQQWAKNAFEEHLNLIKAAKKRLREGKPISHRLKDYKELICDAKEEKAHQLMKLTSEVYSELEIKHEWTEYKDAKRFIKYKDWGLVVTSLKDVLKFLIRNTIKSSPQQLLDPMIWCIADKKELPVNLVKALKSIYC